METQQYYFTEEEYQSNLKVSYNRVINAKDGIGCTANGKTYLLFDYYCKTPDCSCTETFMEWIEHGNSNPDIITFNFDYITRQINQASKTIPQEMLDFLKEEKLITILEQRNILMRMAFDSFCLNRETNQLRKENNQLKKENNQLEKFAKTGKIGRNDPCFCGSGKKYKKCCGA